MISALHVSNSYYSVDTGHGFKHLSMVGFCVAAVIFFKAPILKHT